MPSQEEYLDDLLKDLDGLNAENEKNILGNPDKKAEGGMIMEDGLQLQDDFDGLDMSDMEDLLEAAKESVMNFGVNETGTSKPVEDVEPADMAGAAENSGGMKDIEEPADITGATENPAGMGEGVEGLANVTDATENSGGMEDIEGVADIAGDIENLVGMAEDMKELADTPEDAEDIVGMTEDEVEKLLEASRNTEAESASEKENADMGFSEADDLMQLLGGSEDEELQDIHAMLQKSDNNEAVDDEIVSMLQNVDNEVEQMPDMEGVEGKEALLSDKEKKAAEKKRKKEEKKEAKRQAKAAAKASRAAKKAGKGTKRDTELIVEPEVADIILPEKGTGEQTVDEIDPDLLEALADVENMFSDILPNDKTISSASHEEIADSTIKNLEEARKEKKPFLARILDFLTESDDEENEGAEILLSEENETILKEMDKEKGKNKKKGKKGKKQGKAEGKDTEDAGEGEDNKEAQKGKKAKKEKKPKKEKAPKIKEAEAPGKKLSKKRIILIALICASIGLVIVLTVNVGGDYTSKKAGRVAYHEGDFQTCFQNLYGKNLNESEQVMFYKSESILRIRVWLREYELLAQEGSELQALDSLIQSVDDYPTLYEFSSQWNASSEVAQTYDDILKILLDKYHLTEEQAKEIAATPDDVTYTKKVMAIVNGEGFGSWDKPKEQDIEEEAEPQTQPLPDMLPEEEELPDIEFLDNHE